MLIGAGLALLVKAGAGIPVLALAPFPLAVIGLLVAVILQDRRAPRADAAPHVTA